MRQSSPPSGHSKIATSDTSSHVGYDSTSSPTTCPTIHVDANRVASSAIDLATHAEHAWSDVIPGYPWSHSPSPLASLFDVAEIPAESPRLQHLPTTAKRQRILPAAAHPYEADFRFDSPSNFPQPVPDGAVGSTPESLVKSGPSASLPDVSRKDFQLMGAAVVNRCIQQGRLPLFGSDAVDFLRHTVQEAIRDPHVISRLGVHTNDDDVTRWQAVLQHADLSRLEIETEQSGAAMASNYLNRKISERWSCKAKSLLKLIRPITSTPLRGSAIHDVRVLRAIGKWAGVSVGEVTLRQCVLGIWRVNKMLEGVSLKSDIQRARERVKGHSRIHTEFELARGMWEAELRSLEADLMMYTQQAAGEKATTRHLTGPSTGETLV